MNRQEKTSFKIFHIYYNRMKKIIHWKQGEKDDKGKERR